MPSALGLAIKKRRQKKEIGLRELARRVKKSPSFLSVIENAEEVPAVAEETLHALEKELGFDAEELVTLAGRTPEDVAPADLLEVELYRQVKRRSKAEKEALLRKLRGEA